MSPRPSNLMPKRTLDTTETSSHAEDACRASAPDPGTISAALNDSAAARAIPEHTKRRILEAARELNYKPNYFARSLRLQRTYTIGVIAQQIELLRRRHHQRNRRVSARHRVLLPYGDPSSRSTSSTDLFANAAGPRMRASSPSIRRSKRSPLSDRCCCRPQACAGRDEHHH